MIKLCGKTIAIFLKHFDQYKRKISLWWLEKNIVVLLHKRDSKNLIKDYWLSLFSVKILKNLYLIHFSNILYKTSSSLSVSLASFYAIRLLLNSCQLHMKSENDLTVIRHTRVTFLDISKVFDKVWHKCSIFKIKSYYIDATLLKLMESYFNSSSTKGCFKWSNFFVKKYTDWSSTGFCVGTSSILIDITELPNGIKSIFKIFADDT